MTSRILIALACAAAWALPALAIAQPAGSASTDDLIERLSPPPTATRGLRNLVPEARSVELVVQFDFDSARVQPASEPLLDNLARAMRSERLSSLRFRVEGHTDAKGGAAYNLRLSQRRAEAVIAHLAAAGVERSRLSGEGRGASDLLRPDLPHAMDNRRVRITTLP